MSKVSPLRSNDPAKPDISPQPNQIAEAIRILLASLSEQERAQVLRNLVPHPLSMPKAGDVLTCVLRAFPPKKETTVEEVKQHVAAEGVEATPKEIYNALGYLTRKQYVRRLSYGRYLIDGNYFETADDLGGEPSRDDCE